MRTYYIIIYLHNGYDIVYHTLQCSVVDMNTIPPIRPHGWRFFFRSKASFAIITLLKFNVGKMQRFGDNSEIEHLAIISKKSFAIFDVSHFWTLVEGIFCDYYSHLLRLLFASFAIIILFSHTLSDSNKFIYKIRMKLSYHYSSQLPY